MAIRSGTRRLVALAGGVVLLYVALFGAMMLHRRCSQPVQVVHKHTVEREWVRFVAPRHNASARVLVMQTSGHGKYEALLKTTRIANERWAAKHGYDYLSVTVVYHGGREWLSTFNKAFMVAEALNSSRYDLVFYMDADALVRTLDWDVRSVIPEGSKPTLLFAHPGSNEGPWDINAGVMLWDLRHARSAAVVADWVDRCTRILDAAGEGQPWFDDQALLHHTLRDLLGQMGFAGVNDGSVEGRRAAGALGIVASLPNPGGAVVHLLRSSATDWSGDSVAGRVEAARKIVAGLKESSSSSSLLLSA